MECIKAKNRYVEPVLQKYSADEIMKMIHNKEVARMLVKKGKRNSIWPYVEANDLTKEE